MEKYVSMLIGAVTEKLGKGTVRRIFVSILAVVMFIDTTAALAMPAITMNRSTVCGLEEHSHTDSCYGTETGTELTCVLPEHIHSDSCYFSEAPEAEVSTAATTATEAINATETVAATEAVTATEETVASEDVEATEETVVSEEIPVEEGTKTDAAQTPALDSGTCGESLTWEITEEGGIRTLTISGTGNMTDYEANPVPWAKYQSSISVINVMPGVTSIGDYAFSNLSSLTSISLPEGLMRIGRYAFYSCTSLTGIRVPDSVTYIGEYAFCSCTALTEFTVPKGVTTLHEATFDTCTSLKKVELHNNITTMGPFMFWDCSSLTSVSLPDSLTEINNDFFYGCTGLTEVVLPKHITKINNNAFGECYALKRINIPKSVTYIGEFAFLLCTSLEEVHIEDLSSWCNISFYSFYSNPVYYTDNIYMNGELITDLVIPEGVTFIPDYAFYQCEYLTSVTIPNSVTSIGSNAFSGCSGITELIIPDSVTSIGSSAFYNCSGITELIISNSVTSIGSSVFSRCSGITELIIPNSVAFIDTYAFQNCSGITKLLIPDSVTSIGNYAFQNCTGITELIIPDSVTSIGNNAFQNCSKLTKLTIPDSVTSIGGYAFQYCSGITELTIPDSVTSIGSSAFYDCSGITELIIPDSVTSIGSYAFRNCTGLESVVFPANAVSIGYYAFADCTGLKSIVLNTDEPNKYETKPFSNCTALKTLFVGSRMTTLSAETLDLTFKGIGKTLNVQLQAPIYLTLNKDFTAKKITSYFREYQNFLSGGTMLHVDSAQIMYIICDGVAYCVSNPASAPVPEYIPTERADGSSYPVFSENIPTAAGTSENWSWQLYPDGSGYKLVILGSGSVRNDKNSIPWSSYSDRIASVYIADTITEIGDYALAGCSMVTSIRIPRDATKVSALAFRNCTSLKAITLAEGNRYFSLVDGVLYNKAETTLVLCPPASNIFVDVLPTVTFVSDYAFFNCSALQGIRFQPGYIALGKKVFPENGKTYGAPGSGLHYIDGQNAFFWICDGLAYCVAVPAEVSDYALPKQTAQTEQYDPYPVHDRLPNMIAYGQTGNLYWYIADVTNRKTLVITGEGNIPNYTISVSAPWSEYRTQITDIIVHNGITAIGDRAFSNCENTNITIPESVVAIGNYAFFNCTALMKVTIPDSVTSIGENAFKNCSSITELTLSNSLTSISDDAFYGCSGITELILPDSVTSIGEYAFRDCSSITALTLSNNLTSIGEYAFYGCKGITELILPDSLTSIGGCAFYECDGITELIIPDSVTSIGGFAFYRCKDLTQIKLPNHPVTIADYAFAATPVSYLNGVIYTDPDGILYRLETDGTALVVHVPENFEGTIPTYIDVDNVRYTITAPSGTSIIDEGTCGICGLDWRLENRSGVVTLVISGTGEMTGHDTATTYPWHSYRRSIQAVEVQSGVTSIDAYAFSDCTKLTDVTIADTVTSIGPHAFTDCKGITELILPDSVTSINDRAFRSCTALTDIEMKGVTSIGPYAFSLCSKLESVVMSGNATYIGEYAFASCYDLVSVEFAETQSAPPADLPANVNSGVGTYAFLNCSLLTDITLSGSLKSIDRFAFSNCDMLQNVTLLEGFESIGNYAFYGLTLKSITLPASLKEVGTCAFLDCNDLSMVHISDLAKWCEIKFSDAYSNPTHFARNLCLDENGTHTLIKDLVIPDTVTEISNRAFKNCTKIESLTISENVTAIHTVAFWGCSALKTITLNAKELSNCCDLNKHENGELYVNNFYDSSQISKIIVGAPVEVLHDDLFNAVTATARKKVSVEFEGPSYFKTASEFSIDAPDRLSASVGNLLPGKDYYVDKDGVIYCLDTEEGATLIYVPAPTADDSGVATFQVPGTVPDADNNRIPVTGVGSNTLVDAVTLTDLTFVEPDNIQVLADFAMANCPTLVSVNDEVTAGAALSIFSQLTSLGNYVLFNTGLYQANNEAITITAGGGTVIFSTQSKSNLYTGAAFKTEISLETTDQAETATEKVRLYFLFSTNDGFFGLDRYVGSSYVLKGPDGQDALEIPVRRIENSNIYYMDLVIEKGRTANFTVRNTYPSPSSGGGTLMIWGKAVDYTNNDTTTIPAMPAEGTYHLASWHTIPNNYNLSYYTGETHQFYGDGTENGVATVRGLYYEFWMPVQEGCRGDAGSLGLDLMRLMNLNSTFTLSEDLEWADGVFEAIKNGNWRTSEEATPIGAPTAWYTHFWVTIDGEEKKLFTLTNSSLANQQLLVTDTDQISLRWSYINSSPDLETGYLWGRIFIGDDMVRLKEGSKLKPDSELLITSDISIDQIFSYSEPQLDSAVCKCTLPVNTPVITLKTWHSLEENPGLSEKDYTARYGEAFPYTIEMYNQCALPVESVCTVTDTLHTSLYIKASDIYNMICTDPYGKYLTVTIQNANLYHPDFVAELSQSKVTGTKGNPVVMTVQNSSGPGNIYNVGQPNPISNSSSLGTIAIRMAEADLDDEGNNRNSNVVDIYLDNEWVCSASSPAELQSALDNMGYFITSSTAYSPEWNFGDAGIPLYSGQTRTLQILSTVKDGFMRLGMDQRNSAILSSGNIVEKENDDMGVTHATLTYKPKAGDSTVQTLTAESKNVRLYRDFTIFHDYYQKGKLLEHSDRIDGGGLVDAKITINHEGKNAYDALPAVHYMNGAMSLLVRTADNPQLSDLPSQNIGGLEYYVLQPGDGETSATYRNVWIDGFLADSVTVTKPTPDAATQQTLIRWYMENISGNYTAEIDFPVLLFPVSSVLEHAVESLNSVSWINDHQSHRLWSPNGLYLSLLDFDKSIVESTAKPLDKDVMFLENYDPNQDKLLESSYSVIRRGDQVTYRIRITGVLNQACVNEGMSMTLTGDMLMDALPLNPIDWSGDNISISYVWDSDTFTSPVESLGTLPRVSFTCKSNESKQIWSLTDQNSLGLAEAENQQYIQWFKDNCSITFYNTGSFYIYVTLDYPDGNEWNTYLTTYGNTLLTNSFYLSDDFDSVQHSLNADSSVLLVKGVNSTGIMYDSNKNSTRDAYAPSSAANSRKIYISNDTEERRITYYVALYNDGPSRLYLNPIHDILPEGFKYVPGSVKIGGEAQAKITRKNSTAVIYKSASVRTVGDTSGSYIVFDFANSDSFDLSYDNTFKKYYLMPHEALVFTYQCTLPKEADAASAKVNTAAMPYFDYNGGGVTVADDRVAITGVAPPKISSSPNDGACSMISTEDANFLGLDTSDVPGFSWLRSNVTVSSGNIVPNITKKVEKVIDAMSNIATENTSFACSGDKIVWSMTATNGGNTPIVNYVLTDVMQKDFDFVRDVMYTISYNTTYSIDARSEKLFAMADLQSVEPNADGFYSFHSNVFGDYLVSYVPRSDINNATLSIHFMDPLAAIPEGGYGQLTVTTDNSGVQRNTTYFNRGYITTSQSWNRDLVAEGDTVDSYEVPFESFRGNPSVYNEASIPIADQLFTTSEKLVTEVDYPDNSASCNTNKKILLKDRHHTFTYTLSVTSASGDIRNLCIEDVLPHLGDSYLLAEEYARNSEFRVILASDPAFKVSITDENNNKVESELAYSVWYCNNADGEPAEWISSTEYRDSLESVTRIRFKIDGEIPNKHTVAVQFNACVDTKDSGAVPGATAWNSFSYEYEFMNTKDGLSAEPSKVGVQIPGIPSLVKNLETPAGDPWIAEEETTFSYIISNKELTLSGDGPVAVPEGAAFTKVSLTVPAGSDRSNALLLDKLHCWTYDGQWTKTNDPWHWIDGNTYYFYELSSEDPNYIFGYFDAGSPNGYSYTYNGWVNATITSTNFRDIWNIQLMKVSDTEDQDSLPDAWFGLYSAVEADRITVDKLPEGLTATVTDTLIHEDTTYYLCSIACSDAEGSINWKNLSQQRYLVLELQAPAGYHLDKTVRVITRQDVDNTDDLPDLYVINKSAVRMPESGGVGNHRVVLPAILLIVSAAYLLLLKKKRETATQS